MGCPHTNGKRGKLVRVIMRDGRTIIDRFHERTGRFVLLKHHKLDPKDIRSLTDWRPYMSEPHKRWDRDTPTHPPKGET